MTTNTEITDTEVTNTELKSYNKKFNAKRAAESLAKRFVGYTVADPVAANTDGEWYPALMAPKSVIAAGVPDEIKSAAYVNGAAVRDEPEPVAIAATCTTVRAGSKREIVANLLLRESGATAKEILSATGWKALNIPGTARDLGITVRQVKEGRTTTYFGSL